MATVARGFTHFDRTFVKGYEVADDDPLVALAPHLFEQPDPEPEPKVRHRRIRGPLVDVDESHGPELDEEDPAVEATPQPANTANKKERLA